MAPKKIEPFLEFAEAEGVSEEALEAAEGEGLLPVYRAAGRRLVLPAEVSDEAMDFARSYHEGELEDCPDSSDAEGDDDAVADSRHRTKGNGIGSVRRVG